MNMIVVVGSINIDLCCYLDRWPEVHETVQTADFKQFLGGKGANQAAAARLGADVTFIGAIGQAAYAGFAKDTLATENMALNLVEVPDTPTGMAFIDIAPNSDNMIRLVGGANASLTPDDIRARQDAFRGASVLLLQNEVPLSVSTTAAEIARKHGATVIMDPAPSPSTAWSQQVIRAFDIFTPNAVEASLYCGFIPETPSEGREAAAKIARNLGCSVIVTMGGKGAAWSHGASASWIDVPKIHPLDTVGAGDCFNGAFATALIEGCDWKDAMQFAINAASISTMRRGALTALPSREEVHKRLESV